MSVGYTLEYSTKEYPETFYKGMIKEIIPKSDIILFNDGYYKPNDFHKLKFVRPGARAVGSGLMSFSAGWFLYGGLATLTQPNFTMDSGQILIGGVFALVGYGIRKIFGKRRVTLNKYNRLRIVDLRFSVDPNSP